MNRDRFWTILLAGGIALVLVLGWVIGVSPVLAQATTADSQRSTIAASNRASEASIVFLRAKFAGIDKLTTELGALSGSVPADASIPIFLRELDGLSNAHSVGIASVVVSLGTNYVAHAPVASAPAAGLATPTPTATPSPSPTAGAGTVPVVPAGAAGRLVLIPVAITVTGAYSDIMAFVGGLQSGPRLYLISTLGVTGTVAAPSQYTGSLSGFVYALPLPVGVASLAGSASGAPATPTPTPSASVP